MPVTFNGVGSGLDAPNSPDRAANVDMTRRIDAPHSRHAVSGTSLTGCRYSFLRVHTGRLSHVSATYS